MFKGLTPTLSVRDIGMSFEWFEALGWERTFSWNEAGLIGDGPDAADANQHGPAGFGGVCCGEITLFLSRDPEILDQLGEHAGFWMTLWVATRGTVDEVHEKVVALGYDIAMPPRDEPWGLREFHLRHPDGHVFRVSSGIDDDAGDRDE